MTLEQIYNENYVLYDGEISSIHFDYQNGTIIKIIISTKQYLKKEKYRTCKLLMTLTKIVELNLFDNSEILGNYSDITILKLENGNYYVAFDPYDNTNKPHENDNNIFISENIEFEEIYENNNSFIKKIFTESDGRRNALPQ